MVISNLNTKLIQDRLASVIGFMARLRRLAAMNAAEFKQDDTPAIAESYLRRSLEAMFDLSRHIVAKQAGKAAVEYKQIARQLGQRGVVTPALTEKLVLMAGYRNRMVHFYHEVTDEELFDILTQHLSDIEAFVREIGAFLEAYRARSAE